MTTIGLISDDDKEAYRDTFNTLDQWYHLNNLILSGNKTNEVIVADRSQERKHAGLDIIGATICLFYSLTNETVTQDFAWLLLEPRDQNK